MITNPDLNITINNDTIKERHMTPPLQLVSGQADLRHLILNLDLTTLTVVTETTNKLQESVSQLMSTQT